MKYAEMLKERVKKVTKFQSEYKRNHSKNFWKNILNFNFLWVSENGTT